MGGRGIVGTSLYKMWEGERYDVHNCGGGGEGGGAFHGGGGLFTSEFVGGEGSIVPLGHRTARVGWGEWGGGG